MASVPPNNQNSYPIQIILVVADSPSETTRDCETLIRERMQAFVSGLCFAPAQAQNNAIPNRRVTVLGVRLHSQIEAERTQRDNVPPTQETLHDSGSQGVSLERLSRSLGLLSGLFPFPSFIDQPRQGMDPHLQELFAHFHNLEARSRQNKTLTETQSAALATYLASQHDSDRNRAAIRKLFEAFSDKEINELIESLSDIELKSLNFELVPPYINETAIVYFSSLGKEFLINPKHEITKISRHYDRFIINFLNVGELIANQSFIEQKIAPYLASAILKKYHFSPQQNDDQMPLDGCFTSTPHYSQKLQRLFIYLLEYFSPSNSATLGTSIARCAFIGNKKGSSEEKIPFIFTLRSYSGIEDLPFHVRAVSGGNLLHCLKIERIKSEGLKDEANLWINGDGTVHLICDQNNQILTTLPLELEKGLDRFSREAAKAQSRTEISGEIFQLKLPKSALQACPKVYLKTLLNHILQIAREKKIFPRLKIIYTSHDNRAVDSGGLTRDFLRTLFESLFDSQKERFLYSEKFGTVAPISLNTLDRKKEVFKNLGMLLMYIFCVPPDHLGNTITPGRFFDDALFKALFTLSYEEITERLDINTKFKMYKALLEGRKEMGDDVDQLIERVKFVSVLDCSRFDKMLQEEIKKDPIFIEAFRIAETHNLFYSSLFDTIEGEKDQDNLSRPENAERLLIILMSSIYSPEIVSEQFSSQIEPIHILAKGMLEFLKVLDPTTAEANWEEFRKVHYLKVSSEFQGNIDRLQVANFEINRSPDVLSHIQIQSLEKKTLWLQEWLVGKVKTETGFSDEDAVPKATHEEVRRFLIFATGASSLPQGRQIKIQHQNGLSSLPKSHTCQQSLEISPDFIKSEKASHETKEGFIKCIQEALPATEFGFE